MAKKNETRYYFISGIVHGNTINVETHTSNGEDVAEDEIEDKYGDFTADTAMECQTIMLTEKQVESLIKQYNKKQK